MHSTLPSSAHQHRPSSLYPRDGPLLSTLRKPCLLGARRAIAPLAARVTRERQTPCNLRVIISVPSISVPSSLPWCCACLAIDRERDLAIGTLPSAGSLSSVARPPAAGPCASASSHGDTPIGGPQIIPRSHPVCCCHERQPPSVGWGGGLPLDTSSLDEMPPSPEMNACTSVHLGAEGAILHRLLQLAVDKTLGKVDRKAWPVVRHREEWLDWCAAALAAPLGTIRRTRDGSPIEILLLRSIACRVVHFVLRAVDARLDLHR